ncbi:MAG: hypothetical protein LUH15_03195 [Tannerellaceae bacterium]|nr:hypothetical protein [Tannerellaceae bacterium]
MLRLHVTDKPSTGKTWHPLHVTGQPLRVTGAKRKIKVEISHDLRLIPAIFASFFIWLVNFFE